MLRLITVIEMRLNAWLRFRRYLSLNCESYGLTDPKFKQLVMGHDMKLDKFYYDQENEESRKKIIIEYMKAVDTH
jgi:hypothetical protein